MKWKPPLHKCRLEIKGRQTAMQDAQLDLIKDEVQRLDPSLEHDQLTFQIAVILISAAFVTGPDTQSLATFTGYSPGLVAEISGRMHRAGLWRDGTMYSDHWFKGKKWTVGIWADCLVAAGLVIARQREDRKWEYRSLNKGELQ